MWRLSKNKSHDHPRKHVFYDAKKSVGRDQVSAKMKLIDPVPTTAESCAEDEEDDVPVPAVSEVASEEDAESLGATEHSDWPNFKVHL